MPSNLRSPLFGMALVGFGAIGFGLMPLFARAAYAEGLSPLSLLVWRFAIAVFCCLPWLPRILAARRDFLIALVAGAGYMASMLFYFVALKELSVALTVLILFTYPLFTILIGWLGFGARLTRANLIAALLVLLAAGLILSPDTLGDAPVLPVLLGFLPPLAYALFIHLAARRLSHIAIPVRLSGVFSGGLVAMLLIGFGWEGGITLPGSMLAWGAAAALAVLSTFGALGLLLLGAPLAGPERSAIAGAGELITSLLVGLLAFAEPVSPAMLGGAALILAAIFVSARIDHEKT
ncbi:DMT family transporter [Ferrovibrio sp.]|uniref:DMT family transporter n=1 Tax=Ferrovibrio sp. TaxID=1917215 RepID=UPI001B647B68|nr:DMT family transporter [Ferrovibrio sp.]MBP7064896.1 DMT family transporter [Ferrovibrio sp.]